MIKLRYDSRDKVFHQKFGQVFSFPDELNLDSSLPDAVQPAGDIKCTCYTTCDIAEDQDHLIFDINDLWNRIPKSPQGADPRDVLEEAVANGLLPVGKTERLRNWRSYWRADLGPADAFDNVRSALMLVQSPIGVGTYWYKEWLNTEILPLGTTPLGGHMYEIEGWKEVNGEPHFIIEAWLGKKLYMSRETFNQALKPMGMQTWVLSTSDIDVKREKTLIERIKDACINLIIALRDKIKTYNVEPVVPMPLVEATTPVQTTSPQIQVNPSSPYDFDTPTLARHSVRVICDEEGLTVEQKDTMCATVGGESGWKPGIVHTNYVIKNGVRTVASTDYGIAQINDFYHIGPNKDFPSSDYVLSHPEECIRWMCKMWKAGNREWWIAYKSGEYKKYL